MWAAAPALRANPGPGASTVHVRAPAARPLAIRVRYAIRRRAPVSPIRAAAPPHASKVTCATRGPGSVSTIPAKPSRAHRTRKASHKPATWASAWTGMTPHCPRQAARAHLARAAGPAAMGAWPPEDRTTGATSRPETTSTSPAALRAAFAQRARTPDAAANRPWLG